MATLANSTPASAIDANSLGDNPDLIDVLDQIADIQITATCVRLALFGRMEQEAGSEPYFPIHALLMRLESDIGTLAVSAGGLRGGADVERI